MSQGQGPCWVRKRLEARALVILTHTGFDQQAKLFCRSDSALQAGSILLFTNDKSWINFFHFLFKNILFFISLSYVCLCFCLWVCASKSGCPGNPEEGVGIPEAGVTSSSECWELNSGSLLELVVPAPNCWTISSAPYNPIMLNLKIKLYQLWFISSLPKLLFLSGEKKSEQKQAFLAQINLVVFFFFNILTIRTQSWAN